MNQLDKLNEYNSFNVGTGRGTSIKDVLKIIEKYLGENNHVDYDNLENDYVWCSNKKSYDKLNWAPKTKLDDGIKFTIDYYLTKSVNNSVEQLTSHK